MDILITGGEGFRGLDAYRECLMHDTYDIIQPDLRTVGGLLTMRKVAAMCEAYHKPCIGHGAFGLSVAGRIQAHAAWGAPLEELALATPPLLPQEQWAPALKILKSKELYTLQQRRNPSSSRPGPGARSQRRSARTLQNLMARIGRTVVSGIIAAAVWYPAAAAAQGAEASRPEPYVKLCAGCHGDSLAGTERGPALLDNRSLRSRSEKQIHDLIQNGSPGKMPPFALPENQLQALARWVRSLNVSAFDLGMPGDQLAGEQFFFGKGRCGSCHMVRGVGKSNGPDLSGNRTRTDRRANGAGSRRSGCACGQPLGSIVPFLGLVPQPGMVRGECPPADGSALRGFVT